MGFCLLRKLTPVVKMNKNEKINFDGNTFFSHSKTNSGGVLISYTGMYNFVVNNPKN